MNSVVGIDLGTTYSALARVDEAGRPEIVPNAEGEKITPSVVLFEGNTAVVGTVAKEALVTEPENVVQMVKRQMGSNWTFPYNGREYAPEQISALILRKVVQDAEDFIGPVRQVVITVPAYFNDAMRTSTKTAGEMAGLDVLGLVNEPTAAAIAFGLQKRMNNATIAVMDLGGGTFDVTVMEVRNGDLTVRSTGGDNFLGGANFDKKIFDHFADSFLDRFGIDISSPDDVELDDLVRIAQDWLRRAERLKRDLTIRPHASTSLTGLGKTMRVEVTREEFAYMTRVLMQEIEDRTLETVHDSGLRPADLDMVLLVGGSTRMPMIRSLAEQLFGQEPNTSINPDEAVALGASLFAANRALRGGQALPMPTPMSTYLRDITITDVASHSIGVQAYNRPPDQGGQLYNAVILRRNVPLPFAGSEIFYTGVRGQTTITIEILEGDDPDISYCRTIGKLNINGLPPGRAAGMPVVVVLRYNENGILQVEAIDQTTGMRAQTTIDRSTGLSEKDRAYATAIVKELVVQ